MLDTKGYLVNILNPRLCSHYFRIQHSNYSAHSEFTYWSGSLLKGHNFQSFIPIAIKASF
jgi:hypothetical protein